MTKKEVIGTEIKETTEKTNDALLKAIEPMKAMIFHAFDIANENRNGNFFNDLACEEKRIDCIALFIAIMMHEVAEDDDRLEIFEDFRDIKNTNDAYIASLQQEYDDIGDY